MSRDVVKRAIITERSTSAIRTHLLVNAQTLTRHATVRAAIEAFMAVSRKWRPDHAEPAPMDVDAMTRKGRAKVARRKVRARVAKTRRKKNRKNKDTDKEKVMRFVSYCGHCGKWEHRQKIVGREMDSQ